MAGLAPPSPATTPTASPPTELIAAQAETGWLHTDKATVVDALGKPFQIKAVNWFGLETSTCAPHGLSTVSINQLLDDVAHWGFNTIRLPYANACIEPGATVSSINSQVNPGLVGLTPLQLMDTVVAGARARGLRVILDQHRFDSNGQAPLWYEPGWTESRWISDWQSLAARYAGDPTVIGADLHNEPADPACWGCGAPGDDWQAAATRAGDAIQKVNPHLLIVVEGVQRESNGHNTWWGGGLSDAAAHPVQLAVANQLVYSVHDYPASVYPQPWFSAPDYPADLPGVWTANWGYLVEHKVAPVFLGEFGTQLQTASDKRWLAALVSYIGAHRLNFGYWDLNPDSGDTGGLLGDDWTTPMTAKLDALAPLLGKGATTPVPAAQPKAISPPRSSTRAAPATGPSARPASALRSAPAIEAPPSASVKSPGAPSSASAEGPAAPSVRPSVTGLLESSWSTGYVAQLTVSAPGGNADGWTVAWPDRGARAVTTGWGVTCHVSHERTSCRGADWAAHLVRGQTVTVGVEVADDGIAPSLAPLAVGP